MHGGAGALISIGLLQSVDWTSMERCVNHQWSSGRQPFPSSSVDSTAGATVQSPCLLGLLSLQ